MKANCVNVLNKTVNNVCKLENQINTNTSNIEFTMKYLNFNKSLLLSLHGARVNIPVHIQKYSIEPSFLNDNVLKQFILSILNHFNNNSKENYYILAESLNDLPLFVKNVKIPSIIQVSLVEADKSGLITFLDSIRTGHLNKLGQVVDYLSSNFDDVNSFALAILHYLDVSPEITYNQELIVQLHGNGISSTYDELNLAKDDINKKISRLLVKNIEIKNVLDTVNIYIRRGQEEIIQDFKNKSHNDPFYPQPATTDFIKKAKNLFLEDNNLDLKNGELYDIDAEPFQPYEPGQPIEPSEPSSYNFNIHSNFADLSTLSESQDKIEFKIKQLLELTETETE